MQTAWWSGGAAVLTFDPAELVATKIRALYQRSKGRDLFDLWLALTLLSLEPERILAGFAPYRPTGLTSRLAIANLRNKLSDEVFLSDLDLLLAGSAPPYDIDAAADLVIDDLLSRIDRSPTVKGH